MANDSTSLFTGQCIIKSLDPLSPLNTDTLLTSIRWLGTKTSKLLFLMPSHLQCCVQSLSQSPHQSPHTHVNAMAHISDVNVITRVISKEYHYSYRYKVSPSVVLLIYSGVINTKILGKI